MGAHGRAVFLVVVLALFIALSGLAAPGVLGFGHEQPARALLWRLDSTPTALPTNPPPLSASLTVNPSSVQSGDSISVQTTANGGTPPYQYNYNGLPSGCQGQPSASFSCIASPAGTYQLNVSVSDSNGNQTFSNGVTLDVTSSNNGGNGGGGGGSGNNSSNPISSLLSGLGGIVTYVLIFGIIGFATWILLIVGVWVIAVVLMRRLPKRGASVLVGPSVNCAACSSPMPTGSKFCPQCGASTSPKTS
jgi:hypothetical protein